jgi:hypothetical protein
VIEAEEGEDGGVEVVWADLVGDGFVAEFVGGTVGVSWAGTAAGHPDGEGGGIVVASDEGHFATAAVFAHGGAAEFAAPDDEGIIEETAAAEVGEEGVAGLVDAAAFVLEAVVEGFFASGTVAIPAPVEELDEADAKKPSTTASRTNAAASTNPATPSSPTSAAAVSSMIPS